MLTQEQKTKLKAYLDEQVGKPYVFGIENDGILNPGAWDCSELVQNAISQVLKLKFCDGARYQLHACRKLGPTEQEQVGDLGFLVDPEGTPARHVVMVYDEMQVVEARGRPFSRVILCDKNYWINRKGFLRWYRPTVYG